MGPVKYGLFIGIPSWRKWGPWAADGHYYDAPWETSADMFGGVKSRNHSTKEEIRGILWLFI